MSQRQRTIDNHLAAFDTFAEFTSNLTEDEWNTQSLCPDWTVHGIVAHTAAIESVLLGWFPASSEDPPPFEKAGEFMKASVDMTGPELRTKLLEIFAGRKAELEALTDEQFDTPSLTPVGLQTYGRFMAIRIFDLWTHEQDMRVPLGKPGNTDGPVAEQSFEEIEGSIGYIAGKKIGLEDGQSICFEITGPIEKKIYVAVDGRAKVVDAIENPTATLVADSLTFALLACGRVDPQEPIDSGDIGWEGDATLGEHAARNLRFTM